jgi:hypothetical protein
VLLAAEVVREHAGEGALDQRLCELREEAVLAEQVLRILIIFRELAEQFGTNRWHIRLLSRLKG